MTGFQRAVGSERKPFSISGVHWAVACEGPTAKLGPLVVSHGLLDFRLGVHDERAVLGNGFAEWATLKEQAIYTGRSTGFE